MVRCPILIRPTLIGAALALPFLWSCGRAPNELPAPLILSLTSPGIAAGVLDKAHTCGGMGISPALLWDAPPPGTRSLALTVTGPRFPLRVPLRPLVLYDIPATEWELPAGFAGQRPGPPGVERGRNDDDRDDYVPPCPPGRRTHRYGFVLYALDTVVNTTGLSKADLLVAVRGHLLAKGELIGRGSR